ncbi:MAG: Zn-dependent alcohol dehydrogenase [Pseudomonadota bacterium]
MKAAVCREFGAPLVVEELALASPGPGEVEVAIKACAVCHSDMIFASGGWGGTLPAVYGHEAAGVVADVGPGVQHLRAGDHAVVTLVRSCGRCRCCEQGFYGSCESHFALDANPPLRLAADGSPVAQGLRTAAFAERVVVDASQVVAIDDSVPMESAALLACGVITGFGAVINTVKVPAGASVVVIGTGGVGLNSVQGAAVSGASRIIAVDVNGEKLEAARRFGATHAVDASEGASVETVRALTNGRGADYVFITVGAVGAYADAYQMLAKGGAAVIVGMTPVGATSSFDPLTLADSSMRIVGSKMGSSNIHKDLPNLVELYHQGRLKLDELVSGRYRLDEINDAFASVERGEALRNVIVF